MTARSKVLLLVFAVVLVIVAGLVIEVGLRSFPAPPAVRVQAEPVTRQDLIQTVAASGRITPLSFVSVGAEQSGRITAILVSEGETVKRGQLLARLESTEPRADVDAQRAAVKLPANERRAAEAAIEAGLAAEKAQQAGLVRVEAESASAQLLYGRARELNEGGLIARDEYDRHRAEARAAEAYVEESKANLARLRIEQSQLIARRDAAERRHSQAQAQLLRMQDVLRRHSYLSPIDGIVTDLLVKVGETVSPGARSAPAGLLMRIADMSVVAAELLVDKTDGVGVRRGQTARIQVDALPGETFTGAVIEIGAAAPAIRDFNVTTSLEAPPASVRPGMTCAARITTAAANNVLTIPAQALTQRVFEGRKVQGVFVVEAGKAVFHPVETGISSGGRLEVLSGLSEGAKIVTGGNEALRSLESETLVRVESP